MAHKLLRNAVGCVFSLALLASGGFCFAQGTNPIPGVNNEINSEWVESSSPLPGGGRVTTTDFVGSDRRLTKVIEPVAASVPSLTNAAQRPQLLGGNLQGQVGTGYSAANLGYGPVATGNGTVLIPVVQYVPMSSNAQATYQAAYSPIAQTGVCTNCQTPQIPLAPQYQPTAANQTPVLPVAPTAGNFQAPMGNVPGFYNQAPGVAAAPAASGYKSLVPRSLPAGTYIGQGWLGQPKAYVNSQPFRNFLRYLIVP